LAGSPRNSRADQYGYRKRYVIHGVCVFAMLVGAILAIIFANKMLSTQNPDWHLYLPISAGILLFASTLVFYLKWNDDWFREHAHAEFYNRKLNSDILRASWIAELFFESGKKEGFKLPSEVVASFTRNLFVDSYSANKKHHPFDQILDTVGKVSTIKFGKGIWEVSRIEGKAKEA
jgi:hypothetical protein